MICQRGFVEREREGVFVNNGLNCQFICAKPLRKIIRYLLNFGASETVKPTWANHKKIQRKCPGARPIFSKQA
jgi:hypothetical protein